MSGCSDCISLRAGKRKRSLHHRVARRAKQRAAHRHIARDPRQHRDGKDQERRHGQSRPPRRRQTSRNTQIPAQSPSQTNSASTCPARPASRPAPRSKTAAAVSAFSPRPAVSNAPGTTRFPRKITSSSIVGSPDTLNFQSTSEAEHRIAAQPGRRRVKNGSRDPETSAARPPATKAG